MLHLQLFKASIIGTAILHTLYPKQQTLQHKKLELTEGVEVV